MIVARRVLLTGLLTGLIACGGGSADVDGEWAGQATDPSGTTIELVLDLHRHGTVLTGTAGTPGEGASLTLEHGTIQGPHLAFDLSQERPGADSASFSVSATISGDRMQGTIRDQQESITLPFTLTRRTAPYASAGKVAGHGPRERAAAPADTPPSPRGRDPVPVAARKAALAAFDDHEVVGLGILSYANQDFDNFILDLIRDPAFPQRVNDIVVECGNSLYQPLLDRFIAGDSVAVSAVQQVWRNTTQPMCGLSSFYEELFPLVRRINQTLPAGRKLRVLAGDPPIDWARVQTREELRRFGDRDRSIANVMEREVLARHRRALMIFGIRHLMHGGGGAVARYERQRETGTGPHITYVIMAHNGFGNRTPLTRYNAALEQRLAAWPVPSLAPLAGTWLADLDYGYFFPGETGSRIAERVDAYLYLCPRALLLNQPISAGAASDTAYLRELARRAAVRGHHTTPAAILRDAIDSSVFFNQLAEVVTEGP